MRTPTNDPTPSGLRFPGVRAALLALSLSFALTLPAAAQAAVAPTTTRVAHSAAQRDARAAGRKGSTALAQRSVSSHRRSWHRQSNPATAPQVTPTPAPALVTSPTHAPSPTSKLSPTPTPSPSPTPTPAPVPPAASPQVLFDGSFSSGFTAWYVQSLKARATLAPGAGPSGEQAGRFEVREGDVEPDTGSQRSEVVGPTFGEQDLYIHDAIRVPTGNTFSAPWQIIQQLHEDSSENSPGVAVFLENDHSLRISSGDSSWGYWQGPKLQTGRWYDLDYRVNLSQDPGAGFVEVWLDGVPQQLVNGQTRVYGPTATAARTFFKAGIYRSKSSTGTSIVEHDDITIGSSLAAVAG